MVGPNGDSYKMLLAGFCLKFLVLFLNFVTDPPYLFVSYSETGSDLENGLMFGDSSIIFELF